MQQQKYVYKCRISMNKAIVSQTYMWYNDEFKILNSLMLLNSYLLLNWREFKKNGLI